MATDRQAWLSTREAAGFLGLNLRTVYRLIDDGALPAYRLGRVIRLRRADVEAYLDSARIEPGSLVHLQSSPRPR